MKDYYFYRFLPEDKKIKSTFIWEKRTKEEEKILALEIQKCVEGIYIDNIFIPPILYYYWNHCYIDVEDQDGNMNIQLPDLRDTDFIIHTAYHNASKENLGLLIGSLRQIGKTTMLATIVSHEICFKKNAEIIALFSSQNDKESFTKKLDVQIKNNTFFLRPEQLDKDWSKRLIRFGLKEKDNSTKEFAKLYTILTEDGSKSQKPAGKTATLTIYDEIAKAPCKKVHEALLPALKSQKKAGKLRAKMLYTFTGGDVKSSKDARKIWENPEFNSFKGFDHKGKKIGFFLSGEYHGSFKKYKTLKEFFNTSNTNSFFENKIYCTDFELAKKELDKEEKEALATDISSYNMRKMYFPRVPEDMFLAGENNVFSAFYNDMEKILYYLRTEPQGKNVWFKEYKGDILAVETNRKRIDNFPVNYTDYDTLDSSIVLLEEPSFHKGFKYYVMGLDDINVIKTAESTSLSSWYIIKRQTTDYTDKYSDSIVCYYNGRTDINTFRQQLLYALKYYGAEEGCATLLHEAANDNLTQWFSEQNKSYMLEDTYNLAREITPNSSSFAIKGLRATKNNQEYMLSKIVEYCNEDIADNKKGIWRIKDPYLIQQMMAFDGDLSDKDAIIGFGHAIIHLYKEKKYRVPLNAKEVETKPVEKKKINSMFGSFSNKRIKLL